MSRRLVRGVGLSQMVACRAPSRCSRVMRSQYSRKKARKMPAKRLMAPQA
jgi:hypothetical protein